MAKTERAVLREQGKGAGVDRRMVIGLSLPAEVLSRTEALAERTRKTVSAVIVEAIERGLAAPQVIHLAVPDAGGVVPHTKLTLRLGTVTRLRLDRRAESNGRARSAEVAFLLQSYLERAVSSAEQHAGSR